jgi:hypothetical protein
VPVLGHVVTVGKQAISAARAYGKASLPQAGIPRTRAWVMAIPAVAVASVRGPTTAARRRRNAGAHRTQTHGRPSAAAGRVSPRSAVSRAC